jgi:hypothetical protein
MKKWVQSIGWMIVTGENWNTVTETRPSDTFSTKIPARTGLRLNPTIIPSLWKTKLSESRDR